MSPPGEAEAELRPHHHARDDDDDDDDDDGELDPLVRLQRRRERHRGLERRGVLTDSGYSSDPLGGYSTGEEDSVPAEVGGGGRSGRGSAADDDDDGGDDDDDDEMSSGPDESGDGDGVDTEDTEDEADLDPAELLRRARARLLEDVSTEGGFKDGKGGLLPLPHSLNKYKKVRACVCACACACVHACWRWRWQGEVPCLGWRRSGAPASRCSRGPCPLLSVHLRVIHLSVSFLSLSPTRTHPPHPLSLPPSNRPILLRSTTRTEGSGSTRPRSGRPSSPGSRASGPGASGTRRSATAAGRTWPTAASASRAAS